MLLSTQSGRIPYSGHGRLHKNGRCWWVEGTLNIPTGGMRPKSTGVFFELGPFFNFFITQPNTKSVINRACKNMQFLGPKYVIFMQSKTAKYVVKIAKYVISKSSNFIPKRLISWHQASILQFYVKTINFLMSYIFLLFCVHFL